jgi:hypothetical protein
MAFRVDMTGGEPDTPDHRFFRCSINVWDEALEVARQHGWQPMGTSPAPSWKELWQKDGGFPGDYESDDYGKMISARDASALADALELAAQLGLPAPRTGAVLLQEGETAEEHRWANTPFSPAFAEKFVSFLRKGEFSFYWDD